MIIGNVGVDKKMKLKTIRHILIFMIFFESIGIFNNGPVQKMEYKFYTLNAEKYTLVEAKVLEKKNDSFKFLNIELVPTTHILVEYNFNNFVYNEWTMSYPSHCEGETITIAVNNEEGSKIVRAIPYKITSEDVDVYLKQAMAIMLLVILIVIEIIIERRETITNDNW